MVHTKFFEVQKHMPPKEPYIKGKFDIRSVYLKKSTIENWVHGQPVRDDYDVIMYTFLDHQFLDTRYYFSEEPIFEKFIRHIRNFGAYDEWECSIENSNEETADRVS